MPAKTIQLPASEAVAIEAVEQRAKMLGSPIGVAAADLIVAGAQTIHAENAPAAPPLGEIHLDALLAEVARRFERTASPRAVEEAIARAEAAEEKLARVQAAFA